LLYTFKFSIIVPFYNSAKYLKKTIRSIIKDQTLDFQQNIQLILVNDGSDDDSKYIAREFLKKYPINIVYVESEHNGRAASRNLGLKHATGKYILFLDSDDYISKNTLRNVYNFFEEHYDDLDVVSLPMKYKGIYNKNHELNYKFENEEIIDLNENPNNPQLSISSSIIKSEVIKDCHFDTDKLSFEDSLLLNKILLNKKKIGVGKGMYYYRITYNNLENNDKLQSDITYYTDKFNSYNDLINYSISKYAKVDDYVQFLILYDLVELITFPNINSFDEKQLNTIKDLIIDTLQHIDIEKIYQINPENNNLKEYLIYLYDQEKVVKYDNEDLCLFVNDYKIESISDKKIRLYQPVVKDEKLYLKGDIITKFNIENFSVNVIIEDKSKEFSCKLYAPKDPLYKTSKILNTIWEDEYSFKTEIYIEDIKNDEFKIKLSYEGHDFYPEIQLYEEPLNLQDTNLIILNKKYALFKDINSVMFLPYSPFMQENIFKHEDFIYNFKFSIVMAVYNTQLYIKEAIDSLINQTIGFERNIELIIVDDGSTDNSIDIALDYQEQYPNNIKIFRKKHSGQSSARDLGIIYAQGKYVNFLDSDDYLDEDALEKIDEFFNKNYEKTDLVSIPMVYFERIEKEHPLNYKYHSNKIINLNKSHTYPQFSLSSSFVKTTALKKYEMDHKLITSDDALFINQILLDKRTMGIFKDTQYHYRKRFTEDNLLDDITSDKRFYTQRLKHFHKYLIDYSIKNYKNVPKFIQFMLASDLNDLLRIPTLDIFDNKDEEDEFWNYLTNKDQKYDIIGHINENMILKNRNVNPTLKSFFMFLRKGNFHIHINNKGVVHLKTGNYVIDRFNIHKLWFDIIEIRYGKLYLSGHYVSNFKDDTISINLIKENKDSDNEIYPAEYFQYGQPDRSTKTFLSVDWKYDYNFNVEVPLENVYQCSFHFEITYHEDERNITYTPKIGFRVPSGLTEFNKYFVQDSRIVFYQDNKIHIIPYSYVNLLKREYRTLQLINEDKQEGYRTIMFYRLLYLILYPFMKNKNIWIINDRLDQADENGIHLFKYAYKQDDGIKKYYILDKNCDDYKKLKKEYGSSILAHKSFKHKIIYLFTKKRIASFLNESFFNPFWIDDNYDHRKIYCNLITSPWYFLQHGVIYRDLTSHIKRYKYNLALIVTSADFERQSFFDLKYGFPENVVQTLGLPRYDNLISNNEIKKQILFTPTWRLNLEKDDSLFYNSEYYEMLISFLNNEKLFNLLNEYGYKFIFKPHPQLVRHLEDMQINENIIISTEESYQTLIRDSAIMISDFSSVISDFAYLKKPIIYYQKNDDHHFEAFFDYKTLGFGDVLEKEEEVVDKVKYYLENNCEMEQEYKDRVTNFFKYNDTNNCKRVYEWILKN